MQPQSDQESPAQAGWQYTPEESNPTASANSKGKPSEVSWTASEFIAHHKSTGWYLRLGAAGILAAAIVYIFTRDLISSGMILIAMVALGAFAGRKPRALQYRIDNFGIQVGEKTYPYHDFKSFSVIDEGAMSSVSLLPMKRFLPPLSIYYDPQDETKIVTMLSAELPFEEGQKDAIDRLMHRIRF
jgi:hypothetical protein